MLIAHLVPGYFAAAMSQPHWRTEWSTARRTALWVAALGATAVPDTDVIFNAIFRGFINHSTLWTHSVFPYLVIAIVWLLVWRIGRWPYAQTLIGLCLLSAVSHLVLDVISHGTPLLYPFSLYMFGALSRRVLEGGLAAYLTDPIILLEPLLLLFVAGHWLSRRQSVKSQR